MAQRFRVPSQVPFEQLETALGNEKVQVYLVVQGERAESAWTQAWRALGDYVATELYFLEDAADFERVPAPPQVEDWPEGRPWNKGTPMGAAYGWNGQLGIYLTPFQARKRRLVRKAFRSAGKRTEAGQ